MQATKTRTIRPPVKRHGGKFYLCKRIIELMPPHRAYVEPFVGGGSVLLNKPRVEAEAAFDLDTGLVGMWRELARDDGQFVRHHAGFVPYTEVSFRDAEYHAGHHDERVRALWYLVRSRFSRGGLGKSFAWSERLRGGQPGDVNAWDTFRKVDLPAICERTRGVDFRHGNALELLDNWLFDDRTLVYADPPYVHETRTARSAYEHEMTRADHEALLSILAGLPAKVMLSGYRCDLYDTALAGWRRVEFDMPNHAGQGKAKQRRAECLWMNF